jgi:peptidoglycan/xylan/chitin deacetylase (PgdA/CDA1 family)
MYHYIRDYDKNFPYFNFLDIKNFKKQINFFIKQKKLIGLNSDINKEYFKNKYLLTFDDGFKEHLKVAKYLNERNIMGFFFIPGMQIMKKDFLPIHKIHLIFGKFSSIELINIFRKFEINIDFKRNIFDIFQQQKRFLNNNKKESNIKVYLKTILNNIDQNNSKVVNNIFNYCFDKRDRNKIFKNFYLNSKDIMSLHKLGMKIGGHSYNHKVLSKLTHRDQKKDISKSLKILSKIIKTKIKYFCIPYGGSKVFNNETLKILREKKIELSFNVESKNWSKKSNKLFVPRFDCNEFKFGKIFKYR